MIIEYNFAHDLLDKIEKELNRYEKQKEITIRNKSFGKPDFDWMRKTQDFSLPVFSSGATDIIHIDRLYYEILVSGWKKEHPTLVKKGVEQTIESLIESGFTLETISSAISDKVSNLIYKYDLVLETTKESNHLFGIEDEEKILLIHLNRYREIINSDTKQIDFLHGVILNKKISDLILEIYIRFINARLKMLYPELPKIRKSKSKRLTKILWKGEQKDLLELFVELQEKGWIEEFEYGKQRKIATSICNLFDLTLTKKNEDSNQEESFYQILKVAYNRKKQKGNYDKTLEPTDRIKFDKIRKNDTE